MEQIQVKRHAGRRRCGELLAPWVAPALRIRAKRSWTLSMPDRKTSVANAWLWQMIEASGSEMAP